MKEEIQKIIKNYAHDYRDMKMSENVLETMLEKMVEEIFSAYP